MSFSARQFRSCIIEPTLDYLVRATKISGFKSESAIRLLMGIAAHESGFGTYLTQIGGGPARGVYQMENATFYDLWRNFISYRPVLKKALNQLSIPALVDNSEIEGNLYLATAAARLQLYRARPPLPEPDDVQGLARYWYEHWCRGCAGIAEGFIDAYGEYVLRSLNKGD